MTSKTVRAVRFNGVRLDRRSVLKGGGRLAAGALAMPLIGRFSSAIAAWPDRPIKVIVPFAPGGPVDVIARVLAPPLSEALGGASVVIENRAGATGNVGIVAAARSDPDGYTILVTSNTITINPVLMTSVPYDLDKDFIPLVDIAGSPTGFAVQPTLGPKTLAEFIAAAKASGKFSYSHAGFGTPAHLAGEFLKARAGIDMAAVNNNGAGPAVQSLLTGAVQFCSGALPAMHPHIKAGTLRGLAVTGEKRWFDLPDIPTVVEAGYPGFVLDTWTMMLLPTKTPPEIGERLVKETIAIFQRPEMRAKLRTIGFEATAAGPEALKRRLAAELPMWRQIIATAKIKQVESK